MVIMKDGTYIINKSQRDASTVNDDKPFEMWRQRLDKTPSGAPRHPAALKILKLYCTAEEADFLSRMPAKFCSAPQLARLYKIELPKITDMLERLIDKFLVADMDCGDGVRLYTPMEIIPGFWDLTFMRIRDDFPVAEITELYEQYWDTFYPGVVGHGKPTQDFRVMVREESLGEKFTEILDYERTSCIIKNAKIISVTLCVCSSMRLQGKKAICDRPIETCMSFDAGAGAVLRAGQGREISKVEAMDIIDGCKEHGLVQCADNVKTEPWYICNCCSCCCSMFNAMRNYDLRTTVVSAGFIARSDSQKCKNCGNCVEACPVQCIEQGESFAKVDENICLGCGVCVSKCPSDAIKLTRRMQRIYTPNEYNEKVLAMALERNRFADQIFHDPNRLSHRTLSILINTFLKMPPVKQALTIDTLKSRFLKSIAKLVTRDFDKTVQKEKERLARES
jgi:Pyruvate/2-oxoacid:ferredoxin oxidoreductase delta subunit